jgi:predicted porin
MLFALLGAAQTQAQAQTATVYGIVDQAIEVLSHTAGGGGSLVRLPNLTGSVPSRFGLRGSEDLGGGLKALFALESGFATDTGTLGNGGRFWGRHAYVALAGGWGQLSLGRLPSATFLAGALEPLGGNLYSNASLDGYIPNARSDNSLGLQTRLGSLSLHATYSLGRDTVNGAGPAATNCPGEAAGERRPAGNGRSWRATMVRAGAAPWPWTGRTAARAPPWAWATAPIPIPAAAPTSTACWARPA